jgi:peptidyl-prolyl cis-trans isomerase D
MATLQSIRNHGTILLVVVGVAMLAFILGDFLNSGSSFFNKGRENVAEIAGHKVHYTEYEAAKDQLTEVYKIETGSADINEDMTIQLRNQAWQFLVMNYTLNEQAKKVGIAVTAEELSQLCISNNPHQLIRQRRAFYDETGNFNNVALINFLNSLEQEPETAEQAESLKQAKNYWMYWENAVRLTYLQEKYTNLLGKLVTANPLDAKYAFDARQTTLDIQYVQQPYYAVADSLVKVTEGDIKKLYNEKKELYKQTPNRSIEYVSFPIVPSEEDFVAVENLIKNLESDFKTKEDVAIIVNSNSDILYDGRDYSIETIPAEYKDFAFDKKAKKGDCTEITFSNNTYSIARLMDCGYTKPDSVKLILLATEEGTEDMELGWFQATDLQKNIADPAFNGKKGETFTVSNGMGEQTFKIAEKSKATPKVKLAILSRTVTASSKTYGVLYNQAKQFIVANNNADSLHQAAIAQGLSTTPAYALNENSDKINDLKNSRPIVRWAFEAKAGQVSDVFECGNQFIVAALTEVNDGEYRSLESVKAELTIQAINEKKAAYITNKLNGVTTLADAATLFDTEVKSAEAVSLSSYRLGAAGNEPVVIGTAFTLEPNTTSKPIKGNNGVYMISVGEKTVAEGQLNPTQEISNLNMRTSYTIPYQAISLIEEKANIVDNRARFQ